ncbi:MAG TPA: hypothetical protein VM120_16545 [Bryobacteraceae bacterium]|nr:hypothetical protein [Bryobacteraceae bacterium]
MSLDLEAIAAVGALINGFGGLIGKVNDQSVKAELFQKQIETLSKFQELQAAYWDIANENRMQHGRIIELEQKLRFAGALEFRMQVCWSKLDDGYFERTPYCPLCWEDQRKAVHLIEYKEVWECALHNRSWPKGSSS